MKVIDTSKESLDVFAAGQFDLWKWEHYIDKAVPGAKELCLDGMRKCINAGFSWENDYLPILNAMICDEEKREQVLASFSKVTEQFLSVTFSSMMSLTRLVNLTWLKSRASQPF